MRMVDIGVPQKLVRHILVAYLGEEIPGLLDFPPIREASNWQWAIKDLQKKKFPAQSIFHTPARLSPANEQRAEVSA